MSSSYTSLKQQKNFGFLGFFSGGRKWEHWPEMGYYRLAIFVPKFEVIQLINPFRPDHRRREKINLNFYFHTSLWCLKRFYEGLKGLHKIFLGTTKKCENKNLSEYYFNVTF